MEKNGNSFQRKLSASLFCDRHRNVDCITRQYSLLAAYDRIPIDLIYSGNKISVPAQYYLGKKK